MSRRLPLLPLVVWTASLGIPALPLLGQSDRDWLTELDQELAETRRVLETATRAVETRRDEIGTLRRDIWNGWENLQRLEAAIAWQNRGQPQSLARAESRLDNLRDRFETAFRRGANDREMLALRREMEAASEELKRLRAQPNQPAAQTEQARARALAARLETQRESLDQALDAWLPLAEQAWSVQLRMLRMESEALQRRDQLRVEDWPSAPPSLEAVRIETKRGRLTYEAVWTDPEPGPAALLREVARLQWEHLAALETLRRMWGDRHLDAQTALDDHQRRHASEIDASWRRNLDPLAKAFTARVVAQMWTERDLKPLLPGRLIAWRHMGTPHLASHATDRAFPVALRPRIRDDFFDEVKGRPETTLGRLWAERWPVPGLEAGLEVNQLETSDAQLTRLIDRLAPETLPNEWRTLIPPGKIVWEEHLVLARRAAVTRSGWEAAQAWSHAGRDMLQGLIDLARERRNRRQRSLDRHRDHPLRPSTNYVVELTFTKPVSVEAVTLAGRVVTSDRSSSAPDRTWSGTVTTPASLTRSNLSVAAFDERDLALDDPASPMGFTAVPEPQWTRYEPGRDRTHSLRLDRDQASDAVLVLLADGFDTKDPGPSLAAWIRAQSWSRRAEIAIAVAKPHPAYLEIIHDFTPAEDDLSTFLGSSPLAPDALSPVAVERARYHLDRHARAPNRSLVLVAGTIDSETARATAVRLP